MTSCALLCLLLFFLSFPAFADDVPQFSEPTYSSVPSESSSLSDESEASGSSSSVTEVAPIIDYTYPLLQILESSRNSEHATQVIAGFLLFFVVVVLCNFCYKFFKIFF